jgi:hypothetical protein
MLIIANTSSLTRTFLVGRFMRFFLLVVDDTNPTGTNSTVMGQSPQG